MNIVQRVLLLTLLAVAVVFCAGSAAPAVSLVRIPDGGIQPQIELRDGVVHMVYFSGEAEHGDLKYVRSRDYGRTFSAPLRVNAPGSAVAVGAIRGAQMAVGRNGRVHVAWNGSSAAVPQGPGKEPPMLYTRMNDAETAFEPERNLISSAWGLNGGGALAADPAGNVYVFWHAPEPGKTADEANRRVWIAKSSDDGKTVGKETIAFDKALGVCGCCGMHAFAGADGALHVLFRTAFETVHRNMFLLTSRDHGRTFQGADVSDWNIGACVMSSEAFAQTKSGTLAAWETEKQVYFGKVISGATDTIPTRIGAPGAGQNRKYPVLAANDRGEALLGWTEGTAWKKGGSLWWQTYDRDLKPIAAAGKADGIPVWSFPAAFARPDGSFVLVY